MMLNNQEIKESADLDKKGRRLVLYQLVCKARIAVFKINYTAPHKAVFLKQMLHDLVVMVRVYSYLIIKLLDILNALRQDTVTSTVACNAVDNSVIARIGPLAVLYHGIGQVGTCEHCKNGIDAAISLPHIKLTLLYIVL